MADTTPEMENTETKRSKLPVLIGLVLALVGGAGGFYATWSGMILSAEAPETSMDSGPALSVVDVAYVPVDPLVVSLRPPATAKHLKFRASLEVRPDAVPEVEKILPRVTDVLNSYLRALEPGDLENPAALSRLRAQMLRRVQVVAGAGMVNDLLVMEFVLN